MASIIGATHLIKHKRKSHKPRRISMKCYQDRNNRLAGIGLSYQNYLKTDEWKKIRQKVMASHSVCVLCSAKATCIHHTDYEWDTLLGTCLVALVPLCHVCHEFIEMDGKRKRSLREANYLLREGLESRPRSEWEENWFNRFKHRSFTKHKQDQKQFIVEQKQAEIKKQKRREGDKRKAAFNTMCSECGIHPIAKVGESRCVGCINWSIRKNQPKRLCPKCKTRTRTMPYRLCEECRRSQV